MEVGKAHTLTAWSTLAMAAFMAAAAVFVVLELKEFRFQNNVLEQTLRQAFRPVGVISYGEEENIGFIIEYLPGSTEGKWSFAANPVLRNQGRGILTYVGSLSYLSKVEVDFRNELLNGNLDDLDRVKV